METKIAIFKGKTVKKTIHNKKWWFVIADVIEVLTDSVQASGYIKDMRRRDSELNKGWGQIATPLLIQTAGGAQKLNCANTECIFRIVQSIPSPKAEPFKRWLAKVGYERIQEIENPELATKRTRMLYKLKGYSDDWIEKRMRGIAIREELTDEWKNRGAKRENLRDHMDDLELIFTMLGERATTEIHRNENSRGVPKLKTDARAGGKISGDARKALEKRLKRPVVSRRNYLKSKESQKKLD
ncbi:Bro-N domain-containing protein [bacterium]|nr:Bro-N domain-containing protein [bacterium]MBU3954827.1 Bro-N domain-containing protein [bacterium]MBU4134086.1 Bro-N domain-containing protein [bacterium]